jgi:DNA-binding transcriptional regulator LsrR (DeoR family)
VQLAGALSFPGDRLGSVEVIRQVARVADGVARPLYAPLVVDDAATADALRRQPEIAECLERVDRLDFAVVSVGTWTESGSALYPLIPQQLSAEVSAAGACGEISGRVFDSAGEPVSAELDARVVGITAEQLTNVSHIIATSYGEHRAEATLAAVRAGFVHSLIADEALAHALIELAK